MEKEKKVILIKKNKLCLDTGYLESSHPELNIELAPQV